MEHIEGELDHLPDAISRDDRNSVDILCMDHQQVYVTLPTAVRDLSQEILAAKREAICNSLTHHPWGCLKAHH